LEGSDYLKEREQVPDSKGSEDFEQKYRERDLKEPVSCIRAEAREKISQSHNFMISQAMRKESTFPEKASPDGGSGQGKGSALRSSDAEGSRHCGRRPLQRRGIGNRISGRTL
jgi:hypothetical protein